MKLTVSYNINGKIVEIVFEGDNEFDLLKRAREDAHYANSGVTTFCFEKTKRYAFIETKGEKECIRDDWAGDDW